MHRLVVGGYDLDLPPDFGIVISKSVAEVREPGARNSDWTKTITLPGSKTNKKAFTNLFDLNLNIRNTSTTNFNPDFNPNLKAPAVHYLDELPDIKGFLKLNNIIQTDYETIEFECTLHGKLSDLFSSITEAKLSDLDFTEFNHTLSNTRVTESWETQIQKNASGYVNFDASGNPNGEGYVYSLIDDGTFVNYYGNTNVSQFYPALYTKQIVDKIFEAAGFSYTDDSFFNSAFFKRVITPCPTGMKQSLSDLQDLEFEAEKTSTQSITSYPTTVTFTQENSDPGNHYSNPNYTGSTDGGLFDFYFVIDAELTGLTPLTTYVAQFNVYKNGLPYFGTFIGGTTDSSGDLVIQESRVFNNMTVNDGDELHLVFYTLTQNNVPVLSFNLDIFAGSLFYNKAKAVTWGNGNNVNFAAFFHDDVTQYDFLKSVFNQYCLYAEPTDENEMFVQTREDFYRSDAKDWTDKLDQSQPLNIIPMGELDANPYYFTYTAGDDLENKNYQAAYNRIYGDKKYFIQNDFLKKEKKIDVIFAPSQIFRADGYDKTLTYIPLEMDNGTGQLRQLYYGGLVNCNAYLIFDSPAMSGSSTSRTNYPFTAHIDSPDAPTLDLSFGAPFRVNLPTGTEYTNNNLFNQYWRKYIEEITDKDSKLVRGMFRITAADMAQLSFRDLYYFERNYFRLNAINDYNPDEGMAECEFLFLKQAETFTAASGSIGGDGDIFGDFFPSSEERRMIDGSKLGQVGLVVGRNNGGAGEQSLIVGDNIAAERGRINSVIGSKNILIDAGVERATVIGSNDIHVTASGEFWMQNAKWDLFNPSDGNVPQYNSSNNTYENVAMAATSSGVYTPILTETSNINDSEPYECQWMRVGDVVTVSGRVDMEPTAALLTTVLNMSLPISTVIFDFHNIGGAAVSEDGETAAIRGGPAANDASFRWTPPTTNYVIFFFSFTYRIQ